MNIRDNLSTYEKYKVLKKKYEEYIIESESKIKHLIECDKKGEQPFPLPNKQVISNTWDSILKYRFNVLEVTYSMGGNLDEIREKIYPSVIEAMEKAWHISNGYVSMVWVFSIGMMLEVDESYLGKLADLVDQNKVDDFLISYLINYKFPNSYPKTDNFLFPRPYKATYEVVSMGVDNKEKGLERLKKYLTKEWYRGHSDMGWYNSHKSKWDIHQGYWCFESGALVKILNLDDSSLKDLQYYPYDMVHYKKQ